MAWKRSGLRIHSESGLTLVELLVVLAIIAALAGMIYPAVVNSIYKSQVVLAAQRIDAIEKAKIQYMLDNPNAGTATFNITDLSPYMVQFGQALSDPALLSKGTGGTIDPGNFSKTAYYTPNNAAAMQQFVKQYNVPTTSGPEAQASPPAAFNP